MNAPSIVHQPAAQCGEATHAADVAQFAADGTPLNDLAREMALRWGIGATPSAQSTRATMEARASVIFERLRWSAMQTRQLVTDAIMCDSDEEERKGNLLGSAQELLTLNSYLAAVGMAIVNGWSEFPDPLEVLIPTAWVPAQQEESEHA